MFDSKTLSHRTNIIIHCPRTKNKKQRKNGEEEEKEEERRKWWRIYL